MVPPDAEGVCQMAGRTEGSAWARIRMLVCGQSVSEGERGRRVKVTDNHACEVVSAVVVGSCSDRFKWLGAKLTSGLRSR